MSTHRKTPRTGTRRRPARRRPVPRRTGRRLLVTAAVLAVTAGGAAWYAYRDLTGSIASSKALDGAEKSAGDATNILLMGLDSRKDRDGRDLPEDVLEKLHAGSSDIGGYNANTLILLNVPADGGRAKAFSIPRDDLVDIPGRGQDKIKKAYGLAKAKREEELSAQGEEDRRTLEREGREAGRKAEIETVRNFLGVPVDHFAELNLAGFHHLADALGGVPVCLKHDVKDGYSGADFTAGHHTLDGRQSLAFVRQRHGLAMGDLDRTRRQQAFLAGARYKLSQAGTFTDPAKLVRLLDTARQDLVTDEGSDLLSFVQQAKNLSGGDVEFVTLPIKGFARNHGEDVNVVDDMKIKRLIAEQIGPKAAADPDASGAPGATAHSPAPASSPAPSTRDGGGSASSAIDGGGIPCVD
ncbi:LCP family protein [Streptomyces sp. NPDC101118]|uniref:LCP family protein n=1 Tax=Streptomyces sp. NPDC101118 TaxID=3366109 RepID=UPI003819F462